MSSKSSFTASVNWGNSTKIPGTRCYHVIQMQGGFDAPWKAYASRGCWLVLPPESNERSAEMGAYPRHRHASVGRDDGFITRHFGMHGVGCGDCNRASRAGGASVGCSQ